MHYFYYYQILSSFFISFVLLMYSCNFIFVSFFWGADVTVLIISGLLSLVSVWLLGLGRIAEALSKKNEK